MSNAVHARALVLARRRCDIVSVEMKPNLTRCTLVIALLSGLATSLRAQTNEEWTRPFAPLRMIGNIYWVGSYDLSTYLITTPQGNILINTGVGDTAQQIKKSVEQLGF